MNISGVKSLCLDTYSSIIIRTKNKDEVQIDVKNKNKDLKKTEEKLSYDELKELSLTELLNKIIKYYLENNTLNYINDLEHIDRYEGKFFIALGTRNIGIQVPKNILDKNNIKLIIKKYIKDRNNYLNSNNINNIVILESNKSSYEIIEDKLILSLKINSKQELLNFEKDFLINYIKKQINSISEKVKITYSSTSGYNISSSNFFILLSENIYEIISNLILEHNKKFKDVGRKK